MRKQMGSEEITLTAEAKKLTDHGFPIIALKDKIAIFKYKHRRKDLATTREIDLWFSNGNGKTPRANGIAIAINDTEFGIDTDGEKCESLFMDKIVSSLSSTELQDKIYKTMHTKTPHGHHRTFRYIHEDFPDGIKEKTFFKLNGEHSEIALKGKDHIFVERGPGYEIINSVEDLVTLTKAEVNELLGALGAFSTEHEALTKVVKKLQPYYVKPNRDNIIFAISGYLHKGRTPEQKIIEVAQRLIEATGYSDENPAKIFQTIRDTCAKDPDSDQVSGYKRLHEALTLASTPDNKTDDVSNTILEIEYTLKGIGLFTIPRREHQQAQQELLEDAIIGNDDDGDNDNELEGIHDNILVQLNSHIYAVVSSNPPVMYVAHRGKRKIIKAVIKFLTETDTTSGNKQNQGQKIIKQLLLWTQQLILAITVKVVINDSPIDENKTYQVTFISRSKDPFTIGPGSINYIVEELANRGKILRKAEAADALTAILNRYEELGLAEVNESVTQTGYYYIKGRFEVRNITQTLDQEPNPNKILECTDFLDELSTRWHNKDIFPTVIKWTTLAPFNFIFKANDKWLRNIHAYGWSSSGKTSLGKIALAVWRLHTNALRKDYQLRFSNIDTPARFGSVISRSTYPKVINEAGGLQDKFNRSLLDLVKGAIEAPYVRGKFFEGKYQNIPALCSMFLTSNSRPPDDSGYRSRTIFIQHTKDDVHERGQKEAVEFEKWLDAKLNILGVLGDFIARYVIVKPAKPEKSILFSGKSHEDIAKEVITEFYKSVGKDKPQWLDSVFEQRSIVEENTEWAYFEIRGFLMNHITEAYSRHIRTLHKEHDPDIVIDFLTRLNFCITNKLLPYLHAHKRKDGTEEIVITHDILRELTKRLDHIEGITTLEDLGKEIPGFEYCQRKLGSNNKNAKVLAGKREDFVKFLEGNIEDGV
jgi:hypothetical protein